MTRSKRCTYLILLVLLLVFSMAHPVVARDPAWGPEDYHFSSTNGAGSLGDDYDDDFNITDSILYELFKSWTHWMFLLA